MDRRRNPNVDILEVAADRLRPLLDEFVFLGGCAAGLLLTDAAAPPVRATVDVDAIVEVGSLQDYYRVADRLRECGFREDQSEGAPICRWSCPPVLLDVMPTQPDIIGFGNPWYALALQSAQQYRLPSGNTIRLVTAPCFVATKLAAFESRGGGDYVMSHDLEDIIVVIDGRSEIIREIARSEFSLWRFLASSFKRLMDDSRFMESLPAFLPGDAASQARLPTLVERLRAIAALA